MSDTHCARCGSAFPVHPKGYTGAAGYAITPDDQRICYPCANKAQSADLVALPLGGRYSAYLAMDRRTVTTWSGGYLGKVSRWHVVDRVFVGHHYRLAYFRMTAKDGAVFAGTCPIDTHDLCTLRRIKGDR